MAWRRSKTGQIIWYINRTYRVLPTDPLQGLAGLALGMEYRARLAVMQLIRGDRHLLVNGGDRRETELKPAAALDHEAGEVSLPFIPSCLSTTARLSGTDIILSQWIL